MLYQQVFGCGFNLGIDLPGSFIDQSYKNDECPCFVCHLGEQSLFLWVDFEMPEKREDSKNQRYTLDLHTGGQFHKRVIQTDCQEEITEFLKRYSTGE
ncbi:hypothetical protein [Endozoicomonas atrinae]|uniref:hypothetical protein n=1 Tax=Endozoicomonas atrinae TaxID=1333660 RepID=UPI000824F8D4|nr:hypothetical protein [Endozoicomonas atrinae]